MSPPLDGKVAVITGAGRGIGAATARRLAADGAAVAVLDLTEDATADTVGAIESAGGRALGIGCDVVDAQQVSDAITAVREALGGPHILVNNAGVIRDNLLFKMTEDDWDTVLSVHLRGAFLCTRAAQQAMVEQRWGRIVNISSTSALGNRGQANYAAAKAGMQGFTRTLAMELGPLGITANAVAPGFIETAMTDATARRVGMEPDEFRQAAAERVPLRRTGRPEDVAGAIAYFVGPDAGFVTGQCLYVDGGQR